MNVTIFGAGNMARAISILLLSGGNNVTLLCRDADKGTEVVEALSLQAKKGATIKFAKLGSPIQDPIVINTIWYNSAVDVVASYSKQLSGKILVDITNPLNQTFDDLTTPPGSSAAEELAKLVPKDTKVLKAFNTNFAGLLNQGHVGGHPLDVLIAGDDAEAKAALAKLVEEGGQRALDVGPLRFARQLESLGLLMIVLQSKVKKPGMSSFKLLE
ncbi:MAG: NAD(P)-binding domain-containing protein [Anaerolineaceae bacterium]|nr:NAD(P)-binding domain-containing protein [Anaerolineaceae bacterium]